MQKRLQLIYLLMSVILVTAGLTSFSQSPTSFETSFETGQPRGTWYSWASGFTPTFNEGEMVVTYNKTSANSWDRLVQWIGPFNMGPNPYYHIRLKSDADRNALLTFKDADDVSVNKNFQIIGDNQYRIYFFNLTEDAYDLDLTRMVEIQYDLGGAAMSGTLVFDEVKLGDAAVPSLKPPTMDPLADLLLQPGSGAQSVELTGISDGDGMSEPIAISVSTDNENLITDLAVEYTPSSTMGTLTFNVAPELTGQANITVTLTDAGDVENVANYTFMVMVENFGGTGFAYDFSQAALPSGVTRTPQFNPTLENNAMRVSISKNNRWSGFYWDLGAVYDISENPYLNLSVRTENDQILQVFLVDVFGNGYETVIIQTQFTYHELVANKNEFRQNRLYPGDNYVMASYDFTGANPNIVDLSKITGIQFVTNGTGLTYDGVYHIDEIRMGDQAQKLAYVGQIPDHSFYINSEGKRTILVPEIKNAESLELSVGSGLIENIEIEDITYTDFVENGRDVTYGFTKINFDLIQDAVGTVTASLKAIPKEGYAENSVEFDLTITDNNPPVINEIDDVVIQTGVTQTIQLAGIGDGDRDIEQEISVTASSENTDIVSDISVSYASPSRYGSIEFTALVPGETEITVTATDEEEASTSVSFTVTAYASLNNPPVISQMENVSVINSDGPKTFILSGIHDGDNGDQQLTITAVSSDPEVIPDPVVNYTQGDNQAEIVITPIATATGNIVVTVTVSDDGGNEENDGDKDTEMAFEVRSLVAPLTGYEFDLDDPNTIFLFKPEGHNVSYFLDIVDTLGSKALRIKMKDKWTYGGIWTDIPAILDLSEYPIISYDILSIDNETWHWNYFYDVHGSDASVNRNIENTDIRQYPVPPNEWTTVSFDYRYPGDMNNSQGNPIDGSMIHAVLLNLHNIKPVWPFTDYTGVVYYRNIKIGDKAVFGPMVVNTTINQVPEQSVYIEDGPQHVMLSGLSDGHGSTEGITITINSTQAQIVPIPKISAIQPDGTALLTFDPQQTGTTNIQLTVSAEGAEPTNMNFLVRVIDKGQKAIATVNIDRSEKRQTMYGLGTFENSRRWSEMYAKDLGASAMRIGIIGNQWETSNDNNDPNVINMGGFNYDAFDFDYFRELKEMGVETFILTSWSPPAWMKRNLSLDHREQAIQWELTDNILEPYYYEEYAESMVAVVRAFKDEAGIDIKAIGLQNEPYFNEPYASAILSGPKFAELIEVVGNRFAKEGLDHVGFFMPEQVFGLGWGDYSNEGYLAAVRANEAADSYTKYFAVHGYDGTGIAAGFPTYSRWSSLFDLAQQGENPKELWMTETHIGYNGWPSAMSLAGALHGSLWAGNISLWTNWSFGDMQLTSNVPNSSFYTSMNYFKYIRPGAVRVETNSDHPDVLATAFENPDGRFTVVLINKHATVPASVVLAGDDLPPVFAGYRTSRNENFVSTRVDVMPGEQFILPPNSVTTLITENIFMEKVADKTVYENSGNTTVEIKSITNALGTTDGLQLSVDQSNPGLFSHFMLSEIGGDGTATIDFTPAPDQLGFSEVTLTLTDENDNLKTVVFYINVIVDPTIDASEMALPSVKVYPNPAREYFIVDVGLETYDHIAVIDLNGRTVISRDISSPVTSISTSGLRQGVYFVQVSSKQGKMVKRLVIQ